MALPNATFIRSILYQCATCKSELRPEARAGMTNGGDVSFAEMGDPMEKRRYVDNCNQTVVEVTTYAPGGITHPGFNYPSGGGLMVVIDGREFERMYCTDCNTPVLAIHSEGLGSKGSEYFRCTSDGIPVKLC